MIEMDEASILGIEKEFDYFRGRIASIEREFKEMYVSLREKEVCNEADYYESKRNTRALKHIIPKDSLAHSLLEFGDLLSEEVYINNKLMIDSQRRQLNAKHNQVNNSIKEKRMEYVHVITHQFNELKGKLPIKKEDFKSWADKTICINGTKTYEEIITFSKLFKLYCEICRLRDYCDAKIKSLNRWAKDGIEPKCLLYKETLNMIALNQLKKYYKFRVIESDNSCYPMWFLFSLLSSRVFIDNVYMIGKKEGIDIAEDEYVFSDGSRLKLNSEIISFLERNEIYVSMKKTLIEKKQNKVENNSILKGLKNSGKFAFYMISAKTKNVFL